MRCPSQPLYTRPGSGESIYVYRYSFLTLTCSVRQVFRTFLASRGLLRRCQLAGQGDPCDSSVGLLSLGTPGRPIIRNRGLTPSSVAPECLGDSKSRAGTRACLIHLSFKGAVHPR